MAGCSEDSLEPHQRDRAKESQILLWIWNVLEEISLTDYDFFLKDGTILCSLIGKIKPGSVDRKIATGNLNEKRRNIESFLKACQSYGVPKAMLFQPEDLLFLQHIPRVTRCLFALGKQAEEDPNYAGPGIGIVPYEPVGKAGRRRGGLPLGDDIYVAHINVENITKMLPLEGKHEKEALQNRDNLWSQHLAFLNKRRPLLTDVTSRFFRFCKMKLNSLRLLLEWQYVPYAYKAY